MYNMIHMYLLLQLQFTIAQNSKPAKDNLSKNKRKALKELPSDTSFVVLPADC